jgi:TPR repeat protein
VPINDFAIAHVELAIAIAKEGLQGKNTDKYYSCCGKSICGGCVHSFCKSGNIEKCPFCNSDRSNKTVEEMVEEIMKRVEANDAASINLLADSYYQGLNGVQQDHTRAMELYARSADLGYSKAHSKLAGIYYIGGAPKKAKFHFEAAAMAGNEEARCIIGYTEVKSGNIERGVKHWTIAASAGDYGAMHELRTFFEQGLVSRELIDSTLAAYNNSCTEMRSKARDSYILAMSETA